MPQQVVESKYVCGHCCIVLIVDECDEEDCGQCAKLAENLPGMGWVNDYEYMLDRCNDVADTRMQCSACWQGNPEDHEAWSECGPHWECEGCGDVPGMFADVYKFDRLENAK